MVQPMQLMVWLQASALSDTKWFGFGWWLVSCQQWSIPKGIAIYGKKWKITEIGLPKPFG